MSSFCPGCGKEILWGMTPTGDRVALSLPPERRYMFLYAPPKSVVDEVDTYSVHAPDCPEAGRYKSKQHHQPL
jgi:hypothetical protein